MLHRSSARWLARAIHTMNFPISPIPDLRNRHIQTAGALIIGYVHLTGCCISLTKHSDEILNGKTLDRNSNYFARFCFEHGIDLCAFLQKHIAR